MRKLRDSHNTGFDTNLGRLIIFFLGKALPLWSLNYTVKSFMRLSNSATLRTFYSTLIMPVTDASPVALT